MLKIRLQRTGRKGEPTYRLVLIDKRRGPKSNDFIDILGSYDARKAEQNNLKADKIKEWIAKGAQPSDTVHNLLVEKKIIEGKKINVLPQKSPVIDEEALKVEEEAKAAEDAKEEVKAEEAPKEEEKPAEENKEEVAPKEEEKKEE